MLVTENFRFKADKYWFFSLMFSELLFRNVFCSAEVLVHILEKLILMIKQKWFFVWGRVIQFHLISLEA